MNNKLETSLSQNDLNCLFSTKVEKASNHYFYIITNTHKIYIRKALSNKFTANIPYQRFDNEGFIKLKPMETSQFSGYNAYLFTIEVEPKKLALETRIVFDGKNVSVLMIEYQTHLLEQDTVIDLLKQVIGVENKVK